LLAPIVIGQITALTGNLAMGLYVVAAVLVVGGLTVVLGLPARMVRERRSI
jgi:ACS family phthalate transporter-like MFS transporter